jgi:hypothetical protein
VEETIVVTVTTIGGDTYEVPKGEVDGWTYEATYAQIVFHGSAVPPRGATIEVTYEQAGGSVQAAPDTGA